MLTAAANTAEYASFLSQWNLSAQNIIQTTHSTTSIVTGNSQVKNLIQAETIHNANMN